MNRTAGKHVAKSGHREDSRLDTKAGSGSMVLWFSLLIIAVAFVAYSNSFTNGYAYDDKNVVLNNPNIRSFSNLVSSLNVYRPMRWFTFALDYHFWKLNPIGYHLSNVFLHAICGLLVFFVSRLIIKDMVGALIVSLIFCAHPITTEAVDNISNRNELLGTMFSLSAFYCYIRKNESRLFMLAVLPLHAFALMSKEAIAVSLPLLYIAYDLYFNRDKDGRMSLPRIVPGFAFLAMTILAVGLAVTAGLPIGWQNREAFLFLSANTFVDSSPSLVSLSISVRAMVKGLLLVFYPRTLSADYPVPHVASLVDGAFMGSVIVLLVFVLAVALVARRSRTASFGLLWVLIFLLPVSNVIPVTMHFMADRYLYAPSIGFSLVVGVVITAIYRNRIRPMGYRAKKGSALLLLVMLLALFIGTDLRRNRDWASDFSIWAKTASQQPESPLARINHGAHLQDEGQIIEAIKEYEKAIAIFDGYNVSFSGSDPKKRAPSNMSRGLYASAHNNLGSSYMELRMYKEAIPKLKTAVSLDPYLYWTYCNLGVSYINVGQMDDAIEALRKAIEISDGYPEAHQALSFAYEKKGMITDARKESDRATMLKGAPVPK